MILLILLCGGAWHHKIFCVNVKYGIQYEFRIFLFDKFAK